MPRRIPNPFARALEQGIIFPVWMLDIAFKNVIVTLSTMPKGQSVKWKGLEYSGVGVFGGFTNIEETSEIVTGTMTYTLVGFKTDELGVELLQEVDLYTRQGGETKLWLGLRDSSNIVLDGTQLMHRGLIDVPRSEYSASTGTITISSVSRSARMSKRTGRRYTHEDQIYEYPGDLGLIYVVPLQDKTL